MLHTVRDGTRPNNRGFSRSRGGRRSDLHGKIIRGGNFSSRARSSPTEKREAIVFRVIVCVCVCYRPNHRDRFLSLSLFSIFIFILFYFLFNSLSLGLFPSFDFPSRLHPHANPLPFHPRGSLFSPQVFFIFLPLHFAATGFHGQLISSHSFASYSLFNSHCIFDLAK